MDQARIIVIEAIAGKKVVEARYNGALNRLAPHLLFERHGDLFITALNMDKAWRSPEERRLGQFKLAGLVDVSITGDSFEPLPSFDGSAPKPGDTVILAL